MHSLKQISYTSSCIPTQPKQSLLKTMELKRSPLVFLIGLIIITLQLQAIPSNSQQLYVDNNQLDCDNNFNNTNGFVCNGASPSCAAYVTFRSSPPTYSDPPSIAFLLNSSASAIAQINNISDVGPIPQDRLVVVPVQCSCTRTGRTNSSRYYQHNASYKLKSELETYFTTANNTYQGLVTCQALIAQNPTMDERNLSVGEDVLVPIMCACPTRAQEQKYQAKYLLSYLVTWGDTVEQIASMFGADTLSVLDANELKEDDVIYPFTPMLVPLKSPPTKINLPSSPPPASPPKSNPNPTPPVTGGGSSKKWVYVGVGIGAGVLLLLSLSFFVWFFLFRQSRKPVSSAPSETKAGKKDPESADYKALPASYTSSQETKSWSMDMEGFKVAIGSLTAYKFQELEKATGKFSEGNRIKGSVFRGEINGDDAAIKVLKGNVPTDEINLLKHINHSNIVRLSGYCIHEGNTYLVYEYAEKGSLDDWLFRQKKHLTEDDSLSPSILGWKQRVQIACNVADGLNYLHSYIDPPYIHKNLTTSNVVLDATCRAKITNFGLARTVQDTDENGLIHLTKHVVGTHGYMAPEYIENGVVTTKLDVFAFGVMVLELLSGKPAVKPLNNGISDDLLFIAIRKVFDGENVREKLMAFMDSNLGREYPLDSAYSMAQLALKCVDRDMNTRPTMSEVSMTLSKIYSTTLDWDPSDELVNSSFHSQGR